MNPHRVAYHEGGHALAAWALKVPFARVSIVDTEDSWGHVLFNPLRLTDAHVSSMSPVVRDRLERRVIIGLAGREGERLFTGRYNHGGAVADYQNAFDLVMRLTGHEDEAAPYFKWLMVQARQLIAAPHRRPSLDALVAALIEHQVLEGPAAVHIMREALITAAGAR